MIHDLTPKIIEYLQSIPSIVSLVGDRIISPAFEPVENLEEINPKISLKQVGGGAEYHKYAFIVRGDTIQSSREVTHIIIDKLVNNAVSLPNISVSWVKIDGSIIDSIDEKTKKPETFFHINFYFLES